MVNILLNALLGLAGPLLLKIITSFVEKRVFNKAIELAKVEVDKLTGQAGMDNDAKRQAAVGSLKLALKEMGIVLRDSLLNLAVEMAVVAAKAEIEKHK